MVLEPTHQTNIAPDNTSRFYSTANYAISHDRSQVSNSNHTTSKQKTDLSIASFLRSQIDAFEKKATYLREMADFIDNGAADGKSCIE